jgi:hypothetical protein
MGAVVPGDELVDTVELKARVGTTKIYEFNLKVRFELIDALPAGRCMETIWLRPGSPHPFLKYAAL